MTQELSTTSILALFNTTKEQRQSFAFGIIDALQSGNADPLKIHLQVKCMEDIIKLLNSNTIYKSAVLEAAEKQGQKSFEYMNSKIEIKEVEVKYDYSKCNDLIRDRLEQQSLSVDYDLKQRQEFLKTVPSKGLDIIEDGGEVVTIYPPSKSSTTSVVVTLK